MYTVSVCHVCDSSIEATCPSIPAALFAFLFVFYSFVLSLLCLVNQGSSKGEGWSTANWFKPPSNFITSRPKAALLFLSFDGFRCGV